MSIYVFINKNHRIKTVFVTLFSIYFYYKSSGLYFSLLLSTTIIDFTIAKQIFLQKKKTTKTILLLLSILSNIGLLFYFKYTNFILEIIAEVSNNKFTPLSIILPVGISFFTFQSLSYTIDVYRNKIKPLNNILDYAFFVSFFPQLVAGPIVKAVDFIPQMYRPILVTSEMIGKATFLICSGLIKKTIIADYISINFVDRIFDNPTLYTGLENLVGIYSYALQIYCDFSGYSDMAIGIALLLGYKFNINFDSSYQALNITDFWRRWHISLSTWLRDYVYISLGGNRKGKLRMYFNLFITMIIGGIWHGAGLKFILWGGLHGIGLVIHKSYMNIFNPKKENNMFVVILCWILTFHFIVFAWIYFRADSIENAHEILNQIFFHFNGKIFLDFVFGYPIVLTLFSIGYIFHFIPKRSKNFIEKTIIKSPIFLKAIYILLIVFLVVQFKSSEIQPFIYFQF
jgi:alginate O-acetyltransferase complex protein AlgI